MALDADDPFALPGPPEPRPGQACEHCGFASDEVNFCERLGKFLCYRCFHDSYTPAELEAMAKAWDEAEMIRNALGPDPVFTW